MNFNATCTNNRPILNKNLTRNHYCGGPNHFKRTCIKFQKDQGTFGRGRSTNNGGGRGTFEFRGRGRGDVEAQPTQVGTEEQQTHLNFHQGWAGIPMTHPQH